MTYNNTLKEQVKKAFQHSFGMPQLMVYSPGRINLIGEHTDYNEGFVLPAAIDKAIYMAIATNDRKEIRAKALDLDEEFACSLKALKKSDLGWPNYLMGVVDQLHQNGLESEGFDLVFGGDIPHGSGLSSSAALEVGLLHSLNKVHDWGIEPMAEVRMAQAAENEFVGVRCGIMDQFANRMGQEQQAIRLDCQSLDYEYQPFEFEHVQIILADTQVKHSLSDSAYNERRQQCERAVEVIAQSTGQSLGSLREVSTALLEEHKDKLDEVVYRRATYVLQENQRLLEACEKLQQQDLQGFGQKMYASHHGLQYDYEVSCPELDFLVEQTRAMDFVYGSRMMGGGFGGCTINIVDTRRKDAFISTLRKAYQEKFGQEPAFYVSTIGQGTHVI